MNEPTARAHDWRFFRAGGFDQVRLDRGADLLAIGALDQKLWVALSCPVKGLEFPPRTLALLDADGDGHIRAADLIAAVEWTGDRLRDTDRLAAGIDPLPLAAIRDDDAEGRQLLASARQILANLGKADADAIRAEDASDSARIFAATRFNGDGVITASSTDDPALRTLIEEIGACCGTRVDRNGEPGIDADAVARFFSEAGAVGAWLDQGRADAGLLPTGELATTEAAWLAFAAVRDKIDDWFARCRLAAYDARAADALNGSSEDYRALAARNLAQAGPELAALPLALVGPGRALPLADGINPAWAEALAAFARETVAPLCGPRDTLDAGEWARIGTRLAPYGAWRDKRPNGPGSALAALSDARIAEVAAGDARAALDALIAQDLALADEAAAIAAVERLTCYARDLARLANNFVSFTDFYARQGRGERAVFQAGTLYLDGKSCDLVMPVLEPARHATMAALSGIYLVYCDCTRGGEKTQIAAAITAGDADQLMAGRNGVFYDRQGRDWDATITRIVDHPISIRQAFWSPYKKLARLVAEQVQKLAAAKAKAGDDLLAARVDATAKKAETPPPAPAPAPAPFDAARFAGIFAAIGLAVGAVGTALAALVTGFLGLPWWQMPIALGGLLLLISGPAMLLAWFKLRNRNLGPLLDANGWAVNARARINIPFGTALTQLARLPDGAERAAGDPYAERKTPWGFYLFLCVVAGGLLFWASRAAGL